MSSSLLIIDDDITIRKTLKLLFKPEGYTVHTADSGEEGLVQARELLPDLILLDVLMLDMSGFEVCRRLREDQVLIDVPVILITGLDDRQARLEGAKVGADDFITKPFDPVQLLARIRTITRLNRYRRRLEEQEKFRWVVENSSSAYLMLDSEDHIEYANALARSYLSLPDGNEDGDSIPKHLPLNKLHFLTQAQKYYRCEPEEAWENWSTRSQADTQQEVARYLVRPETEEAKAFWLKVDDVRLPSGQSGLVRLHDITEQTQQNREHKRFQTLISHKLRTPLIDMSALQIIQRMLQKTDVDKGITDLLDVALHNSERLQKQILEVLQYVEISHGRDPRKKSRKQSIGCHLSALPELVLDVAEMLEIQAPEIHWEQEASAPEQIQMSLDAADIRCILEHLLSNAQKFHPEHSPSIDISIELEAHQLNLSVQDDGQHLPPNELSKLWLPYYQSEKYFTGEIAGMGLGLSTVAMLVWGVGGEYRISNREDKPGINVCLQIPLHTHVDPN